MSLQGRCHESVGRNPAERRIESGDAGSHPEKGAMKEHPCKASCDRQNRHGICPVAPRSRGGAAQEASLECTPQRSAVRGGRGGGVNRIPDLGTSWGRSRGRGYAGVRKTSSCAASLPLRAAHARRRSGKFPRIHRVAGVVERRHPVASAGCRHLQWDVLGRRGAGVPGGSGVCPGVGRWRPHRPGSPWITVRVGRSDVPGRHPPSPCRPAEPKATAPGGAVPSRPSRRGRSGISPVRRRPRCAASAPAGTSPRSGRSG
jgi:hypothetical protein